MNSVTPTASKENSPTLRPPVMRVTFYDQISSFLMAGLIATGLLLLGALVYWYTTRPEKTMELLPLELATVPDRAEGGGDENSDPNDSLRGDSADDPNPNVASNDMPAEEVTAKESLSRVASFAAQAAEPVPDFVNVEGVPGGRRGTPDGTGRRPLGLGPGDGGGVAVENRWFIKFADEISLSEYAKQLDFFGIELGAVLPEGKLVYLSRLTEAKPQIREANSGKDEKRLFMTWLGGNRRQADLKFFEKAGIALGGGNVMHFYPEKTEKMLANLEFRAANRSVKEIRRTYFVVINDKQGYNFSVTRQTFLR